MYSHISVAQPGACQQPFKVGRSKFGETGNRHFLLFNNSTLEIKVSFSRLFMDKMVKVGSVMESSGSVDFRTVQYFENWTKIGWVMTAYCSKTEVFNLSKNKSCLVFQKVSLPGDQKSILGHSKFHYILYKYLPIDLDDKNWFWMTLLDIFHQV